MLTGIGLVGVLTATFASYFVQQQHAQELTEIKAKLDQVEALLVSRTVAPLPAPTASDEL